MKRLVELASRQDLKAFEDAWTETLASDTSDVDGLLEAISALESQGQFPKAASLLQMLLPSYMEGESDAAALKVLKKLAKLTPRERSLRDKFMTVYRRKYAKVSSLDPIVRHSGLEDSPNLLEAAERFENYAAFTPGAYVEHPAGWGVGIVSSVDPEEATVTIEFLEMPGHELGMDAACSITRHLATDDFKAMKFDRLDQLCDMATKDPVGLVKRTIRSRDRKTTVRDLRNLLTDGVISTKDWSKWWTKARAKVKRDANVRIGTGNNPPIEVTANELSFEDMTLSNLGALRSLPDKIKFVRELLSELESHPETESALLRAAGVLSKSTQEARKKHPGATFSLALMLERIGEMDPEFVAPEELRLENLITEPHTILDVLDTVPIAADRKEILARVKARFPEEWPEVFEKCIYLGESDVSDTCLKELMAVGAFDRLTRVVFDLLKRFREHPGAFTWFVKLAAGGKIPKGLPHPGMASLLEKMLLLHSHLTHRFLQTEDEVHRKDFRNIERAIQARSAQLVKKTLKDCAIPQATDFYNLVRGSRSLPDDVKDSLVATILRAVPEVAKARAEEQEREMERQGYVDERVIYVTAAGYARFESDFNKLVNDEIPMNATEIGRAASYGDLSENAEWSAAIEKQSHLTARAEQMRADLEKARIIDESMINCETVAVGCQVSVQNLETNALESYVLLGPWDADMTKGIISYKSPLGRALLGLEIGGEATAELPVGQLRCRVNTIEVSGVVVSKTTSEA